MILFCYYDGITRILEGCYSRDSDVVCAETTGTDAGGWHAGDWGDGVDWKDDV